MKAGKTQLTRRGMFRNVAAAGVLLTAGKQSLAQEETASSPGSLLPERRIGRMKITSVDTILTGRDILVRIETDAGIVGYGDATNHFLPYSVEGMLKDLIPYLIGEDPERIEYLWQVCFRRRFMRGGPSTGSAIAGIDQALWDIKGKAYGVPVYQLLGGPGPNEGSRLWACQRKYRRRGSPYGEGSCCQRHYSDSFQGLSQL